MPLPLHQWFRARPKRTPAQRRRGFRPVLEALEERFCPAVLTVNSLADTTTADTALTLREAIAVVDGTLGRPLTSAEQAQITGSLGSGDTIKFSLPAGPQTITLSGGTLSVTKNVAINGPGAGALTIDGNHATGVFAIGSSQNLSLVVSISGLTIADGNRTYGGGLFNAATLTVSHAAFTNNTATNNGGGGIYNTGALTLNDCTFTGNTTQSGSGGATAGGGLLNAGGAVQISHCTFLGNTAAGTGAAAGQGGALSNSGTMRVSDSNLSNNTAAFGGGGIYNNTGSLTLANCTLAGNTVLPNYVSPVEGGGLLNEVAATVTITGSTFSGNSVQGSGQFAGQGGGIYNSGGTMVLNNSTFTGNLAASDGGGIHTRNTSANNSVSLTNSTFANNSSGADGGAIRADVGAILTISDCTFVGNLASSEGGAIDAAVAARFTVINSTFTGNRAGSFGGAVSCGDGIVSFTNVTITGNRVGGLTGGGINLRVPGVMINNSIVAGNYQGSGTTPNDIRGFNLSNTSAYNLIGSGGSAGLIDGINGNQVGVRNLALGPLANNGGPTLTMQLLPGSSAIGRGSTAFVTAGETDQRGLPRIVQGSVDIGAFEGQLADPGYELPALHLGTFQYNPAGSPWTFQGSAGLAANGSAITSGNPGAPQGTQVAFVQAVGSISQRVTFAAGIYVITLAAAQRGNSQASAQTFQILVDGTVVGSFNSLVGTSYTTLTTSSFTVTAGSHVITLQGTDLQGGDNTVLLDQVAINAADFQTPPVSPGTFQYNPAGSAWTFSGSAGLAANGSALTSGNPGAPQGTQVAFVQAVGSISQRVTFAAGIYVITCAAAQRGNSQASAQTFQVLVDGNVVGTFNSLVGTSYTTLVTSSFAVTAGSHVITFQGTDLNGGDNTVLLDQVAINAADFQTPPVGPGTLQYNPAGSAWTFSGSAGLAANGSALTSGNPGAPQGTQVAFVQALGSISQSVTFAAGIYVITFAAAQRGNSQASAQTFQVLVDGNVVGTFNSLVGAVYTTVVTSSFAVTAGSHVITFQGTDLNGGDNTVLLDQVAINAADFQTPPLSPGTFQYNPIGSAWAFNASAGLAANGSALTSGNPGAPQGTQVAFLQGLGSVSQRVTFGAGLYVFTFAAAQRGNSQASAQTFQVLVDANIVGTFNGLVGTSYTTLVTSSFAVTAGSHVITFQGTDLNGGDNTVLLDQIGIGLMHS